MCGIWGAFPNYKTNKAFSYKDPEMLEDMMYLTALRGKDSTGIALIGDPKGKPRTFKTVGGPDFLINHDTYNKIREFMEQKAIAAFGHGRFATVGSVTAKNAHPFTHEHITLVHNGTITYGVDEYMKKVGTDNDSHGLCVSIAEQGLVKALSDVVGAYAIIAHDALEKKVYVVTNGERPLHCVDVFGKRLIMSESKAVEYIAARIGTKKEYESKYFPANQIYIYDLENFSWDISDELVTATKKVFTPVPKYTNTGGKDSKKSSQNESTWTKRTVWVLCTGVKKLPNGCFEYEFADADSNNYYAISSTVLDDSFVGRGAVTAVSTKIVNTDGTIRHFIKFRQLVWDPLDAEKKDSYTFKNGVVKSAEEVDKIVRKEDCVLCQGALDETQLHETIALKDGGHICHVCVGQGRHRAFGFDQ
jgi:predicted glutamine amidotransferase